MLAGINDYDDTQMESYSDATKDDITPFMYLTTVNKALVCNGELPPGCPAYYSSINFVLLGYVMQSTLKVGGSWFMVGGRCLMVGGSWLVSHGWLVCL